jgi:hypothetical protein
MDNRQTLIDRSIPFLQEVKDMTPGAEMERWLNAKYNPESGGKSALFESQPGCFQT